MEGDLITIIVPCYNEAAVIRTTVGMLLEKNYRVIVVDDASTDNTREVLNGLPLTYIRHSVNLGQGAALHTGFRYALQGAADFIVTFDADGQHDSADIARMIGLLKSEKAGIVFGSRFLTGSQTNIKPLRRATLMFGRLVNYLVSGVLLSDANNGIRVLSRDAATKLMITENRSSHSAQIQTLVKKNNIKYVECPVRVLYSDYSRKKGLKNINSIRILYDLILYKIFR